MKKYIDQQTDPVFAIFQFFIVVHYLFNSLGKKGGGSLNVYD